MAINANSSEAPAEHSDCGTRQIRIEHETHAVDDRPPASHAKPPTWPLTDDKGTLWDRARLKLEYIDKYKSLTDRGVQIHVGEWGSYNQTPHDVVLAWISDSLSVWKEAGWGNSLWNLRGDFGVRKHVTDFGQTTRIVLP